MTCSYVVHYVEIDVTLIMQIVLICTQKYTVFHYYMNWFWSYISLIDRDHSVENVHYIVLVPSVDIQVSTSHFVMQQTVTQQ